ncbi:hypothetical protein AVEN_103214-1 [Araneus ventricosus]|uniref:Uncharacterized protein n=1 Tax=Araneus ventricosus TaxID=182803 RepID=A0A4Y2F7C6_ARAVE|nr:hypothetical protein AVEN_103214-1 [Araneus ventricosus]
MGHERWGSRGQLYEAGSAGTEPMLQRPECPIGRQEPGHDGRGLLPGQRDTALAAVSGSPGSDRVPQQIQGALGHSAPCENSHRTVARTRLFDEAFQIRESEGAFCVGAGKPFPNVLAEMFVQRERSSL